MVQLDDRVTVANAEQRLVVRHHGVICVLKRGVLAHTVLHGRKQRALEKRTQHRALEPPQQLETVEPQSSQQALVKCTPRREVRCKDVLHESCAHGLDRSALASTLNVSAGIATYLVWTFSAKTSNARMPSMER